VALEILGATRRGRRLDRALAEHAGGLDDRERRQVQELVTGTLRFRGRLDHLLGLRVHRGLESLSAEVLDVLRLGAYQLLRMDGVPAYAAVSQGVEQARARGGEGAARLANAVLRRVAEAGEDPSLFPPLERDPVGHLTTWGSHPRWMVERWLTRWSAPEVARLVDENNRRPAVFLQPWGVDAGEALGRLGQAGIAVTPVAGGVGGLRLPDGADPAAALAAVPALIQDPAAALVARYAAPPEGAFVADLCAAPGGKALALLPEAGYVLAADPSPARLALVRENARRLGVRGNRLGVVAARAQDAPIACADVVLLDVPCTGTGTLRRHPDARWRLRPGDVQAMAGLQEEILEGVVDRVPVGGLLVYSTCTLEPEENEEQVRRFLGRHPEFRMEPGGGDELSRYVDGEGFLRILPGTDGFDGAFAARLVRTGGSR
jgi:16S rRNA (cytosine967-C5)-methyltransferase